MKYMVIGKRNLVPMEPKMAVGLFQAAKQWVSAELAAGRVDLHYMHADGGAGFVIANGASHEGILDRLLEYPMYPFNDWEVIPLVEWSHAYDRMIELLQKIAAMT
jgi:hypothetical protein